MSRNSSGTYTLPSGNPVTTGTTITSTWANSTLSDIATEVTDSLSRSGKGAMTAPLVVTSGSVGAPGIAFDGDTNTGIYRSAVDTIRLAAGGAAGFEATQTTTSALLPLGVTDGTVGAPGLRFTSDPDSGLYSVSDGVFRVSANGAARMEFSGAAADTANVAVTGQQTISLVTGSTGAAQVNALRLTNGNLKLEGTYPTSTTGLTNTLSPMGVIKAVAFIETDGAGGITVVDGQNIASATAGATGITVNFTTALANTNFICIHSGGATRDGSGAAVLTAENGFTRTTSSVFILTFTQSTGAARNTQTARTAISVVIFGRQ